MGCEINVIRQPTFHTATLLFSTQQYTLSCQSLRLIARAEQKGLSSFSCSVCIKWLLVYVIMSTHRKLHICWWENVSHCLEERRLMASLLFILQKKAQTQQAREFQTKSIKEKGVHLSGLFSGDSSAVLKVTISSLVCDPPWSTCPSQCVYLHVSARHVWDHKCCMQPILPLNRYFGQHNNFWTLVQMAIIYFF